MEAQELEVVPFLDGPAAGEVAEVPIGYDEVWRHVEGTGFCLYRRGVERALVFTGTILPTAQEMVDWFRAQRVEPWIHEDGDPPRARRVIVERVGRRGR